MSCFTDTRSILGGGLRPALWGDYVSEKQTPNKIDVIVNCFHRSNDGADKLAKWGAHAHSPSRHTVSAAYRRIEVAKLLHTMCIHMLRARFYAKPLPGRCAGYTEHELQTLQAHAHEDVQGAEHIFSFSQNEPCGSRSSGSRDPEEDLLSSL